ncbi:CrcB family protein [Corynebacterium afermentans]|uniref:CrcB family protein n=1 Tax=Corynebacterium afermentans TaxID=38286 RepID=UPI0025B488B7|nr:CrcB family protein [Corynebacterium afermentans]WJY59542.1 camphor resistance protein CrcB [Corynebacterium afermentans subsp. lipophilum]
MQFDDLKTGLTVAYGAGLGAVARYLVLIWVNPSTPEALALAVTFAVNLVACFVMGLFRPGAFWGVGFLGGFSTLSAVALAATTTSPLWAVFIIVLSLSTATIAWLAGDATREHQHA